MHSFTSRTASIQVLQSMPRQMLRGIVYIAFRKSKIGKRVVVAVWSRVFTNIESYDLIIMPPCIRNKVARSITIFNVYVSRLIINQPAPKLENEEHTSNHISSHLLNIHVPACIFYT